LGNEEKESKKLRNWEVGKLRRWEGKGIEDAQLIVHS
jgi:hypothetical protein